VTPKYYAIGKIKVGGKDKGILMHRLIMNAPKGKSVDHIVAITDEENDNRKSNLRVCTQSQNRQNYKGTNPNNTSGHIGVTWDKSRNKWFSHIRVNWKQKNLGYYNNIEDAIEARRKGEEMYFTIHNNVAI